MVRGPFPFPSSTLAPIASGTQPTEPCHSNGMHSRLHKAGRPPGGSGAPRASPPVSSAPARTEEPFVGTSRSTPRAAEPPRGTVSKWALSAQRPARSSALCLPQRLWRSAASAVEVWWYIERLIATQSWTAGTQVSGICTHFDSGPA